MGVNYGKRSITLDLKAPEAKEIVGRFVDGANAIAENFKPGVLNRLGFSYDWARGIQPNIVYCAISGFGQEGPMSGAGAYDGAVQAISGMMAATGTPESGPLRVGFPVADMTTGMNAAFALASALYRQKATGEGQYLDLSMTDAILSLMNYSVSRYSVAGDVPELLGNNSPTFQGTSSVFPTKDGFLNISVFTDKMALRLCDAIGHPEWKDDAALEFGERPDGGFRRNPNQSWRTPSRRKRRRNGCRSWKPRACPSRRCTTCRARSTASKSNNGSS